jgi:hypothetical protein
MGNLTFALGQRFALRWDNSGFHFWVGPMETTAAHFPTCWDELLDWTEEASNIFQHYLRIRIAGQETTTYATPMEEADHESNTELQFIPHLLKSAEDQIRNLPSMEYLDRIKYLAEIVRVRNFF